MVKAKVEFKKWREKMGIDNLPDEYTFPEVRDGSEEQADGHEHEDHMMGGFFQRNGPISFIKKAAEAVGDLIAGKNANVLHFAQYVHMCTTGMLDDLLPDHDWHLMAQQIHDLRIAYDTADINGDNVLKYDELELVVSCLHPAHRLKDNEIPSVWEVLMTGAGKPQDIYTAKSVDGDGNETLTTTGGGLTFTDFVKGIRALQANEVTELHAFERIGCVACRLSDLMVVLCTGTLDQDRPDGKASVAGNQSAD